MAEQISDLLETQSDLNQHVSKRGFFSFQILISGSLIKIAYILGVVALLIGGISVLLIDYRHDYEFDLMGLLIAVAIMVGGNLLWRIICEVFILSFSLHETAVSILNELRRK